MADPSLASSFHQETHCSDVGGGLRSYSMTGERCRDSGRRGRYKTWQPSGGMGRVWRMESENSCAWNENRHLAAVWFRCGNDL